MNYSHRDNHGFTSDEIALFITAAIAVCGLIAIFVAEAITGAPL